MEPYEISKVVHTDSQSEVNVRLENGWVILAVATGEYEDRSPELLYSLGLPKSADSGK